MRIPIAHFDEQACLFIDFLCKWRRLQTTFSLPFCPIPVSFLAFLFLFVSHSFSFPFRFVVSLPSSLALFLVCLPALIALHCIATLRKWDPAQSPAKSGPRCCSPRSPGPIAVSHLPVPWSIGKQGVCVAVIIDETLCSTVVIILPGAVLAQTIAQSAIQAVSSFVASVQQTPLGAGTSSGPMITD